MLGKLIFLLVLFWSMEYVALVNNSDIRPSMLIKEIANNLYNLSFTIGAYLAHFMHLYTYMYDFIKYFSNNFFVLITSFFKYILDFIKYFGDSFFGLIKYIIDNFFVLINTCLTNIILLCKHINEQLKYLVNYEILVNSLKNIISSILWVPLSIFGFFNGYKDTIYQFYNDYNTGTNIVFFGFIIIVVIMTLSCCMTCCTDCSNSNNYKYSANIDSNNSIDMYTHNNNNKRNKRNLRTTHNPIIYIY
jgi:hypothetical protein